MPILKNTLAVIHEGLEMPHCRTLILTDSSSRWLPTYARFVYGYDAPESRDAVGQLFDGTMKLLGSSEKEYFTETELPIIGYVGRYKITIVTRANNGSILIRDGAPKPIDSHIGLER